ncbi:MAG: antitoxin VapB family protein [Archaeoglobaceae archaeon]|nr:antitoxin VapB family protein [Archaeoglobaceae archaeon]
MKTITLRDEVYEKLLRLKRENESFSDVIEKLIERKEFKIENYFGILKESKVLDEIEKMLELRKSARLRT